MEDEETEQMEEYELMSSTSQESSLYSGTEHAVKFEIRYVERPPDDFFCPVTFELLLEPHQTSCCGNHLSLDAAARLHEEDQRCPLCNSEEWSVVLDKYHRRKVHEVRVRCPYEKGCEWESEVRGLYEHAHSCLKQPWECEHCKFSCTLEEGEEEHWLSCPKYPEPCPNGCEVGRVERCNMEEHRSVCSLEPVTCEMSEFGCSAVVPRKELAIHMQDSEHQHVISVTRFNSGLCKKLQEDVTDMSMAIAQLQQESTLHKQLHTKMQTYLKKTMNDLKNSQRGLQLQVGELKQLQTDMKGRILHEQKQLQTKLIDEHKTMKTELTGVQKNMQTKLMGELRAIHVKADTRAPVEGDAQEKHEVTERMSEQLIEIMRNIDSQRRELTELKDTIQVVQQNVERQSTNQCPQCCLQ